MGSTGVAISHTTAKRQATSASLNLTMEETRLKKLPSTVPVMVLSNYVLFPHSMEALCIFEPRYQEMLKQVLATDCLMTVANRREPPPGTQWMEEDPRLISPISTLGLVRACITHEDGSSHLMLQGLERIRLLDWVQETPFRIAKIEAFPTQGFAQKAARTGAAELANKILAKLGTVAKSKPIAEQIMQKMSDPEMLVDFVASNFLQDSDLRSAVLEMSELRARMEFLSQCF
jgi:Lon protease-like protein